MLLIPAIDLKAGQCVRLKQGLMDQATVFSDSPAEMAVHWRNQGARRLHLVDLDGAFAGKPKNFGAIKEILAEVSADMPVQLGGGIRDLKKKKKISRQVIELIAAEYDVIEVEEIQDLVELALMKVDGKVAKSYILYRNDRTKLREQGWVMTDLQRVIIEKRY